MATTLNKRIVIVSEESVLQGNYKCGIGEVVDTLIMQLRQWFSVTLITPGKSRSGGILTTNRTICLGTTGEEFYKEAAGLIDSIKPDVVHNFDGDPALIDLLPEEGRPRMIYTFDYWDEVEDKCETLRKYDCVTTVSESYAAQVCEADTQAAALGVIGVTNGIWSGYARGNAENARAAFYKSYLKKADDGKKLIVSMGRLTPEKGIDDILNAAQEIARENVQLVVWGDGDESYTEKLKQLDKAGTLVFFPKLCEFSEMCEAMHAADFYLMPSKKEACGLQAMKAARMGCVPIVTDVGGLGENFDSGNAVMITGELIDAVRRAAEMQPEEYNTLRAAGMAGEWTWETRAKKWAEVYGLEMPEPTPYTMQTAVPIKPSGGCPFATKEGSV